MTKLFRLESLYCLELNENCEQGRIWKEAVTAYVRVLFRDSPEEAIVPILSQINPVHAFPQYCHMINFNIILHTTPASFV